MDKKTVIMAAMLIMASFTMIMATANGDTTEGSTNISHDGLNYEIISGHDVRLIGPSNYIPANGNFSVPSEITVSEVTYTVTEIKENAFKGNGYIVNLTIPDTVTKIGKGNIPFTDDKTGAFQGCANLETVTFTGGNVDTFKHTFAWCTKLTTVDFNGVSSVGDAAFFGCKALVNVNNTEGIKTVFGLGFYQCAFTEINLPNLTSLEGNSNFKESKITSITLPSAVSKIPYSAFEGCKDLATVEMDGVKEIDLDAFRGSGITQLTIPAGVTKVGLNAFMGCKSLKTVVFEEGELNAIPESMFNACSSLESVIIPSNIKKIDAHAFRCCTNLKSVTIKEGVTDVDRNSRSNYGSFDTCPNLEILIMPDVHIGNDTFKGDSKLKDVTLIVGESSPNDGAVVKYFSKNWSNFTRTAQQVVMNITLVAADGVTSSDAWSKIRESNPNAGSTVTDIDGVKYVYMGGQWVVSEVPSTFVGGFENSGFCFKTIQTYGNTIIFPDSEVERIGYEFVAWVDGSGNTVDSSTTSGYTTPVKFSATWKAIEYTVNFVTGDKILESKNATIGDEIRFSMTGYKGTSMTVDAAAIGLITGTEFTVDVEKISYTVNFVIGDKILESKNATIGDEIEFSMTGYGYMSKTVDADFIEAGDFNVEVSMIDRALTVYAYNVSVIGLDGIETVNIGSDISFKVRIHNGYMGLSVVVTIGNEPFQVSADGEGTYTIPAASVTGDVVVTASATAIPVAPVVPSEPVTPVLEKYKVTVNYNSDYVAVSGVPSGDVVKGTPISIGVGMSSTLVRIIVTVEMGGVPVSDAFTYTDSGSVSYGTIAIGEVTGDVVIMVAHEFIEADNPVTGQANMSWMFIAALMSILIVALVVYGRKRHSTL